MTKRTSLGPGRNRLAGIRPKCRKGMAHVLRGRAIASARVIGICPNARRDDIRIALRGRVIARVIALSRFCRAKKFSASTVRFMRAGSVEDPPIWRDGHTNLKWKWSFMFNVADALKQKDELKAKAIAINHAAKDREMTSGEKLEYDGYISEINALAKALDKHRAGASFTESGLGALVVGNGLSREMTASRRELARPRDESRISRVVPVPEGRGEGPSFEGIAEFLRDPHTGVRASLAEGGSLQYVVPGYEVLQFTAAYPGTDPLRVAGSDIVDLPEGWVDGNIPIITSGDEPSTYAEGAGPTADQDANIYVAKLTDPPKYAFLCKPTEESFEDIQSLATALASEGIKRVYNKVTKATTHRFAVRAHYRRCDRHAFRRQPWRTCSI